jgi:hypothetical protein
VLWKYPICPDPNELETPRKSTPRSVSRVLAAVRFASVHGTVARNAAEVETGQILGRLVGIFTGRSSREISLTALVPFLDWQHRTQSARSSRSCSRLLNSLTIAQCPTSAASAIVRNCQLARGSRSNGSRRPRSPPRRWSPSSRPSYARTLVGRPARPLPCPDHLAAWPRPPEPYRFDPSRLAANSPRDQRRERDGPTHAPSPAPVAQVSNRPG